MGKNEPKPTKPTHAWGIASLVLGILSLLLVLAPSIGILLAITAIVFYGIQKKHGSTGTETGGLVTGIIGIILNGILLILFFVNIPVFFGVGSSTLRVSLMLPTVVPIPTDSLTALTALASIFGKFGVAPTDNSLTAGEVPTVGTVDKTAEVSSPKISCPNIVKLPTTYEFWGGDTSSKTLFLYADFLENVEFSDGWELTYTPSSHDAMSSFTCEKGSEAGESVNKLYCRSDSWAYEPRLRKNTIDSQGNIVKSDYQYITSFIFDISGKDINNANDLKNLKLESITCSTTSS